MSSQQTLRLRATLKVRNDHMIAAREALGWSQSKLAEETGVLLRDIASLERLDYTFKDVFDKSMRVAVALKITSDEVLPEGMEGKSACKDAMAVREVPVGNILEHKPVMELPAPEAEDPYGLGPETSEAIKTALRKLSFREQEIIGLLYGLKDGKTYTLDEVGLKFKVSRERVRAIEMRALCKLKLPVNAIGILRTLGWEADEWARWREVEIKSLRESIEFCRTRGFAAHHTIKKLRAMLDDGGPTVSGANKLERGAQRRKKKKQALEELAKVARPNSSQS